MAKERSEVEYRLDDLEGLVEDVPEEVEEKFKPYFEALEARLREDIDRLAADLKVHIEDVVRKSERARRNS
jgi:hypothetical protein